MIGLKLRTMWILECIKLRITMPFEVWCSEYMHNKITSDEYWDMSAEADYIWTKIYTDYDIVEINKIRKSFL